MRRLIGAPSTLALICSLAAAAQHGCSSDTPAPAASDPSLAGSTIANGGVNTPELTATLLDGDPKTATDDPFFQTVNPIGQESGRALRKDPFDPFFLRAKAMLEDGRRTFRRDTFGDEAFWGDTLQLHKAIIGAALGGVGAGVSPKTALAVGLKVDAESLPAPLVAKIQAGQVDLDDPATTVALLKLDAVVGVSGKFDAKGNMTSVGIQCALCHSSVDDSFSPGIGRRLDGWANRDLYVGEIISLSPNLTPVE